MAASYLLFLHKSLRLINRSIDESINESIDQPDQMDPLSMDQSLYKKISAKDELFTEFGHKNLAIITFKAINKVRKNIRTSEFIFRTI